MDDGSDRASVILTKEGKQGKSKTLVILASLLILLGAGCEKTASSEARSEAQVAPVENQSQIATDTPMVSVNPDGVRGGCFDKADFEKLVDPSLLSITKNGDSLADVISNKENEGWKIEEACFERDMDKTMFAFWWSKDKQRAMMTWNDSRDFSPAFTTAPAGNYMLWGNGFDLTFEENDKAKYGFKVILNSGMADGLESWTDYYSIDPGTGDFKKIKSCTSATDSTTNKTIVTCK